jgi:hypothetical protein
MSMMDQHISGLKPTFWQYAVIHNAADCFKEGEQVFMVTNPEVPLTVLTILHEPEDVCCGWKDAQGEPHIDFFPPEALLQYKWAALVSSYDGKFTHCLN